MEQPLPNGGVVLARGAGGGVVQQDLLGGLRLAGATLPRDQDALVPPLGAQRAVGVICKGKAGKEGEGGKVNVIPRKGGKAFSDAQ